MIQGVIQILISSTAVRAAVGLNKENDRYKIFPVAADQDEEPPFTVASITANDPNYCKDGASKMDTVSFRLITYAKEYEQLDSVDNAIRFALDGYSGTSADIPLSIWLENQQDTGVNGRDYFARISDYKAHVTRNP